MLFCRFWAQHFLQFIKDSEIIEKINHLPLKLTNSNEVPNSGHKVYTPPLFPHSFWSNWNRSSWIGLKQIQSGSTIFLAILYNFYEVRQIIFILSVDLLQRKWFVTLNCSFGKTIEEKGRSCLQMFSKFFCSFWHFLFYIQHFFFQH